VAASTKHAGAGCCQQLLVEPHLARVYVPQQASTHCPLSGIMFSALQQLTLYPNKPLKSLLLKSAGYQSPARCCNNVAPQQAIHNSNHCNVKHTTIPKAAFLADTWGCCSSRGGAGDTWGCWRRVGVLETPHSVAAHCHHQLTPLWCVRPIKLSQLNSTSCCTLSWHMSHRTGIACHPGEMAIVAGTSQQSLSNGQQQQQQHHHHPLW